MTRQYGTMLLAMDMKHLEAMTMWLLGHSSIYCLMLVVIEQDDQQDHA
jgi:hypothetical protein